MLLAFFDLCLQIKAYKLYFFYEVKLKKEKEQKIAS